MRDQLQEAAWRALVISRPYSTPYLALCCLCGLMSASGRPHAVDYLVALLVPWLFSFASGALNDLAHHRADALAGRGRNYAPGFLLALGLVALLLTLLLALLGGPACLGLVLAALVLGVAYALSKKVPLLANLVRGTATAALVLALGAAQGLTTQTWLIALGVGLLDAAGNIWGDIRDVQPDARSGTMTLARLAPRLSIALSLLLQGLANVAFLSTTPAVLALCLLGGAIAKLAPPRLGHLWFLMLKYCTLGVVALQLQQGVLDALLALTLVALGLPSIRIYTRLHPGLR